MKIGRRLQRVLDELESRGLLDCAVFVAHAGMPQQEAETDLRRLRGATEEAGYLSILIVQAGTPHGTGEVRGTPNKADKVGGSEPEEPQP
jgi:precorrin-2 methylase